MTGSFRNCMGFSLPFKTGPKPGSRIALIAFLCETTNGAQVRAKKTCPQNLFGGRLSPLSCRERDIFMWKGERLNEPTGFLEMNRAPEEC